MRYGDKGSVVTAIQQALLQCGYELPKSGADGHLGDETWGALRQFARDQGIRWTPDVPAMVLAELMARPPDPESDVLSRVHDLTSLQHDPPEVNGKHRLSEGLVVKRDPKDIRGIVIHQTNSLFSVNSHQILAAGGSRETALHRRGLHVGCHVIVFDGTSAQVPGSHICYVNPLTWYVYHAQKANGFALGLEIEGKFPGLIQNEQLLASTRLIEAAQLALKFMVIQARRLGMDNLEFIWAHRQTSSTRRGDPGHELWRRVVLEYAVRVLGLKTEPSAVWGDGQPIPNEWDPAGTGRY